MTISPPIMPRFLPANVINVVPMAHQWEYQSQVVITVDASREDEKVGVLIFSPTLNWWFYCAYQMTSHCYAELLALLATLKIDSAQFSVMLITDSLSVCMARSSEKFNVILKTFYACVATDVPEIRLLLLPVHSGLTLNKTADTLEKMALSLPIVEVLPPFACVLLATTCWNTTCWNKMEQHLLDRHCLLEQDASDHGIHSSPELEHPQFR